MEIYFVTGNPNKVREASNILGFELKQVSIDLHEIQEVKIECVVKHKAKLAFEKVKKPVIVEDTGLSFKAFNDYPGALIKWMCDYLGNEKICKILSSFDKTAVGKCAVCFYDGNKTHVFIGEVKGKITSRPKGNNNFGWDPIFVPEGYNKTFAQMSLEEKNKISHRGKAWKKLKEFLQDKKFL